jgi:hypothetical protein
MTIEQLIDQILQHGLMTVEMEVNIHRVCNQSNQLSLEEYMALERLREAMLAGKVTVAPRKKAVNALETIVMHEILRQLAAYPYPQTSLPDLGDILAYALNQLPALYATTQQGLQYQCQKAQETMTELIQFQVRQAIEYSLVQPAPHPHRQPIQETNSQVLTSPWLSSNNLKPGKLETTSHQAAVGYQSAAEVQD